MFSTHGSPWGLTAQGSSYWNIDSGETEDLRDLTVRPIVEDSIGSCVAVAINGNLGDDSRFEIVLDYDDLLDMLAILPMPLPSAHADELNTDLSTNVADVSTDHCEECDRLGCCCCD